MNKNLHDIDDLFKSSLDGHLEEVPPDVWNNIDHNLDKKQAAFYKRKYFAVRAAAILLVLVGGVTIAAILHFNRHEKVAANPENQNAATSPKNSKASTGTTVLRESQQSSTVESKEENPYTVVNNNSAGEPGNKVNRTPAPQGKGSSNRHGTVHDEHYTAQENKEVAVGTNKNIPARQNRTIKYRQVNKGPLDLAAKGEQNHPQPETLGQTPTAKAVERTGYVEARRPRIDQMDRSTSLAAADLKGAPVSISPASPGQKVIRLRNHYNSWSLSPMYAKNANLNTLKDDDHYRDPRNNSREAKRTEQETKSFSIGLSVQRQLGRNISLQSGVQYFSLKKTIQPKTIFAEQDPRGDVRFRFSCSSGESYLPTKNGTPLGDSIKTNYSKTALSYIQVPLLVSYQIGFGRFTLMPSAGIQASFLVSGKLNSYLEHPATGEEEVSSPIDGLKAGYISGVFQPQLNYKLSDRVSFDINPNINFSLTPINKGMAIKTYQNLFGVGAGLRIKL